MMARLFSQAARKGGIVSLNGALAGLATISAAFVAFAMPLDLFSRLVVDSGLPSMIAAAEPPLGMKARLATIAVGAIFTFVTIWVLLRALDRAPAAVRRYEIIEVAAEPPRVRRADLHPDAPPRPPVLAGRDFGEPLKTPLRVREFAPAAADAEPLELREPEPDLLLDREFRLEPKPEIRPEPLKELGRQPIALETLAAPLPDAANESVSRLMQRLEGGLARRERSQTAEPREAAPIPETPAPDEPAGHRLRSAISDLERMAKRH